MPGAGHPSDGAGDGSTAGAQSVVPTGANVRRPRTMREDEIAPALRCSWGLCVLVYRTSTDVSFRRMLDHLQRPSSVAC
jgi:hypothetical protein